jgi:hypothetical protein
MHADVCVNIHGATNLTTHPNLSPQAQFDLNPLSNTS